MLDKNLNFQEPRFPYLSSGWKSTILAPSVVRDKGSLLCFYSEELTWQVRHRQRNHSKQVWKFSALPGCLSDETSHLQISSTRAAYTHSLSFLELLAWLAFATKQGIQTGRVLLWRLGPQHVSVKESQSVNYK